MRTTIELTDAQRAKLLQLAAEQGEKGYSRLIQEAVDRFLEERESRRERVEAALSVLGSMSESAARHLEESVVRSRTSWR